MPERKPSFGKIMGRSVAAATFMLSPVALVEISGSNAAIERSVDFFDEREKSQQSVEAGDPKIFDQVGDFMETNTGKTLAGLMLVFSSLNMMRTLHHASKLDNKRKFGEAVGASSSLLALSATFAVSTMTEIDPKLPSSLLMAYATFQSAYSIEDERQHWRGIPAVPGVASAVILFGIGTTILIDSLK